MKHAVIIGATSSLAYALCQQLGRQGWSLSLCGRDEEELGKLASDLHIRYGADTRIILSDFTSVEFSAPAILEQLPGTVDAAFIMLGDMGNARDPEMIDNITDVTRTNYLIPAHLITLLTEKMQKNGRGDIVVVSSVAGDRGRQSNYVYGSAKAALTSFCSGVRNKLAVTGSPVHVMTVKPGFIDTPLTYGMKSPLIASREKIAAATLRAMEKRKDTVYLPWFWRYIMLVICLIPEGVFKKLRL